ncbi:recombinase family protein [Rhodococcus sp. H29-C3]|uniref:recombinase family protein n=1 Tax=Rhodococcus sp. H29-C3 TaxID=3046307 RepID=UPI0024B89445|nr:recombinase family protein [Rhodococcus sp. H29-C3]MDJ0362247.1 recombinase family protein [Rhodococcus sp. H29-C3]
MLSAARCTRVLSEKVSIRIKIRPELEKALALVHEIKTAAPDQAVILTVHELKRLARNAAETYAPSAQLQSGGVQLEQLTGSRTRSAWARCFRRA